MKYPTKRDIFNPIDVPADRLWGEQTQRSLQNFDISGEQQLLKSAIDGSGTK